MKNKKGKKKREGKSRIRKGKREIEILKFYWWGGLRVPTCYWVELAFFGCHGNKNILRPPQEDEVSKKSVILVELDPCDPRSHLPLSCHGRYLALSLVELGLKPLPRVSLHLHSSAPHLTRLSCIPSYSPLHVGFAWLWAMQLPGPHGYGRSAGECKEARVKQEE